MTDKEFIDIVSNYEGNIKTFDNMVYIESINEICNYYTNGEVAAKKKVVCKIGITHYDWGSLLFGDEATFSIIGGFGFPIFDKQVVLAQLKRYNFKERKNVQLDFFNLL